MKRADVILGKEYCETAPHAYGAEPRVAARRIRFTGLYPVVYITEFKVVTREDGAKVSEIVADKKIVPRDSATHLGSYRSPYAAVRELDPGVHFDVVDDSIKGGLPAEVRVKQDQWEPTIVAPAAVHRTWAEHLGRQEEARKRQKEHALRAAPMRFAEGVHGVIESASLVICGEFNVERPHDSVILERITAEVKRQLGMK